MPRSASKYAAAPGFSYDVEKVVLYARELKKLERAGPLTPVRVVDAASDPLHPLHGCFEWDSEKAAHRWRIQQARNLINHILLEVVTVEGEKEYAKAFHNVITPDGPQYVSVADVMSDEDYARQVFQDARNRLQYWSRAYKQYRELARIFKNAAAEVRKLK